LVPDLGKGKKKAARIKGDRKLSGKNLREMRSKEIKGS
jgi:hypothetical protein